MRISDLEIIKTMLVDELLVIDDSSDGNYKFINGLCQLFPPTTGSKLIFQNSLSCHDGKVNLIFMF